MKNLAFLADFICFFLFLSSSTSYAQWLQTSNGLPTNMSVAALAVSNQNLFAGTGGSGVYLSTDNGANWVQVSSGLTGNALSVNTLLVDGSNLFAGTYLDGAFLSTDNGASWTQVSTGLGFAPYRSVFSFLKIGENLYAGATLGVYVSTNNGSNWTVSLNSTAYSLAANSSFLFAGTTGGGVYRFPLTGGNWSAVNSGLPANAEVDALLQFGQNLFAGIYPGSIYVSANNGDSWTKLDPGLPVPPTIFSVNTFLSYGQNIFAGTSVGSGSRSGIYLSTNAGQSWAVIDSGIPSSSSISSLVISGSYLFAGLSYSGGASGVWRRPLSEIITSVESSSREVPRLFRLEQNYPNPFNPSTRIRFAIPRSRFVSLKVSNILGQEVATLVNEEMRAGSYEVIWDARGFSSGVYFCRLQTGDYVQAKNLLLLR